MTSKVPLRIAQIIGNTVTGGVPSCVLNYFRFIDREKFKFDFYTYGPSRLDEEIKRLGGNIYYMPNIKNLPKFIFKLTRLLKNSKYDVIHSHMTSLSVFPLFAGRLAGIKNRFCHAHSTTHKNERVRIIKNLLKPFCKIFSTKNIACSEYSAKWMFGRHSEEAVILRNAIDTAKFSPHAKHRKLIRKKWQAKSFIIGHIGRFEYQKNHEFLLKIMYEVVKVEPEALLVLVGQGSLKQKITEQILELGLTDNVIFEPEIDDVEKYYNGFDIFVLPSKYEGLPLVGMEAQAMGLPCIFSENVTKETNITANNFFLATDDPQKWANTIIDIVNSNKKIDATLVKKAGYDIRDAVADLEQLYINAL